VISSSPEVEVLGSSGNTGAVSLAMEASTEAPVIDWRIAKRAVASPSLSALFEPRPFDRPWCAEACGMTCSIGLGIEGGIAPG